MTSGLIVSEAIHWHIPRAPGEKSHAHDADDWSIKHDISEVSSAIEISLAFYASQLLRHSVWRSNPLQIFRPTETSLKTLLLTKNEVKKLISISSVIDAVEDAYRAFSRGEVEQPGYMGLNLPAPRGEIDFKLGYLKSSEMISMKASSGGFRDNPSRHGVPNGMGTILLFDAQSCALVCVMDGSLITGLRTGAAGAISVRLLARKDAKKVTSIGTGNQARMQIRAIREVMQIEEIHAWHSHPETLLKYKVDIESEFNIPVTMAASKREAVEQADILVTTTRGKGALVETEWIKPGTHIVAIGADALGKQELEPEIFQNAKIVTDSTIQCSQKGEIWHALNRGMISMNGIHAEIGEILMGTKAGRENAEEITIFDSTGMAAQDNTTANAIYQSALRQNVGTRFSFLEQ